MQEKVDKLVEECSENTDEVKMVKITLADHENECKCSCPLYIVLFLIIFTISIGIGTYFIYYRYINPSKKTGTKKGYIFQITIY